MKKVAKNREGLMYTQPTILPLENGDRLTRQEFERRYEAMPKLKKAELIERIVYIGSPVRASHAVSYAQIIGWLWSYSIEVPGVQLADLVWQVYDRRLDWFRWHEGTYQPLAADDQGILRSQVFPGLWLAVDALLDGDVKEVLKLGLAQKSA